MKRNEASHEKGCQGLLSEQKELDQASRDWSLVPVLLVCGVMCSGSLCLPVLSFPICEMEDSVVITLPGTQPFAL